MRLIIIKASYDKHIVNIIPNVEKLKVFNIRKKTLTSHHSGQFLFHIVLEVLSREIK
jgi:hypothetical protein